MKNKRFLIDSANIVHYSIECPFKVGTYSYEGEFDIVVIEKDEILYGNREELNHRRSKLCPNCTLSNMQKILRKLKR